MRLLIIFLLGNVLITTNILSQNIIKADIGGVWKGSTSCPLGRVHYTLEVEGESGMWRHDGYGPDKKHPLEIKVKIRFSKGWEGIWVNLTPQDPNYKGAFRYLNALLSSNGRILIVRPHGGIGDCEGYRLTKSSLLPAKHNPEEDLIVGEPENREPTEAEMRKAIESYLYGDNSSLEVNNSINGASYTLTVFEKLGCMKASDKPGYICDYRFESDFSFHSNERSDAGRKHAKAVNDLFQMFKPKRPESSTGRFLYSKGRKTWIFVGRID